ncbi:MAG TPA: PfkB family carbohydrate kinase [Candidatus Limnocylindrales bacterium]
MRLLGVGDNVVDRYRDLGRMFPGGNALNVAVAARRAGIEAAYIGALGTDRAGETVLGALRAEGLELDRLRVVDGPNAWAEVTLVEGDRVFVGSHVGVSRFRLDETDLAYAASFDLIHTGDCSMVEDQVADLAARAPVSFDFSIHREPGYTEALLPHLEIACFSASDLDEEAALDLLAAAVARGPRLALATRGTAPALLFDGRRTWRQAAVPVQVVDTLGAGDSFIGCLLAGLVTGQDPAVALEAAADAAARTCADYGAFGHGVPIALETAAEAAPAAS